MTTANVYSGWLSLPCLCCLVLECEQEHEKTHSGERATQRIILQTYDFETRLVRRKLHAFKRACDMCTRNLKLPKSTPASHIVSEHFGEIILVDCKTVHKKGYIVVAVDHLTTYIWTTFVKKKIAKPIAAFVGSVMKSIVRIRKGRPRVGGLGGMPVDTQLYASPHKVWNPLFIFMPSPSFLSRKRQFRRLGSYYFVCRASKFCCVRKRC